jgi:hypothetical protein
MFQGKTGREMSRQSLKDRRGYRIDDAVGLENIGPILAVNNSIFFPNCKHDWDNPNNTKPWLHYNEQ